MASRVEDSWGISCDSDSHSEETLECGSSSYRLPTVVHTETVQVPDLERQWLLPPHSKALRAFSSTVPG